MAVEYELFVSGSSLTRFLCRGIEMDLILDWGSKLTWFFCAGRKRLASSVGVDLGGFGVGGRH